MIWDKFFVFMFNNLIKQFYLRMLIISFIIATNDNFIHCWNNFKTFPKENNNGYKIIKILFQSYKNQIIIPNKILILKIKQIIDYFSLFYLE